ncbi:helix-turn-helix domain-containing protein [Nocardia pseudobrasiliensis]|uniref:Helix-turn-helix protein n=1 Tax=Nocardia pseudobrasiliensis TaxID=45979 RepID=A0A370I3J4_9NOCA|nr:helix-turn-helix transcriptional regulator [Nocardia pseudobrasiliensis]RDI63884.1 helix-turn-helix protein [Nocardia pseudobrasiliensis]
MPDNDPAHPADGPAIPRRQLGRLLRDLRAGAGLTIAQIARLIERGTTTVQRMEAGTTARVDLDAIEAFCRVCGADGTTTEALKGLAQQGNSKSWYHKYGDLIPANFDVYLGLEAEAEMLTSFQERIPGLLQAADYARTLFRHGYPNESPMDIERRVEMRIRRQLLLTRRDRPVRLDLILEETAIRRVIGSRRIMRAQCRHLADMSTRPNITIRILPYSAGIPLGELTGPLIIMDFPKGPIGEPIEPALVYVEGYRGAIYYGEDDDVRAYRSAHQALARVALSPEASRALLRQVAREYERER